MYTAGIDIGSSNIKAAIWNGSSFEVWSQPTGWDISETSEAVIQVLLDRSSLKMEDLHQVVATGYGRKMCRFAGRSVTEITCHAAGAFHLVKDAETVLDIGGQDVKVIRLDIEGKVTDFLMNDKCAAGTGRFISNMAVLLGYSLKDFSDIPAETEISKISSMYSFCRIRGDKPPSGEWQKRALHLGSLIRSRQEQQGWSFAFQTEDLWYLQAVLHSTKGLPRLFRSTWVGLSSPRNWRSSPVL